MKKGEFVTGKLIFKKKSTKKLKMFISKYSFLLSTTDQINSRAHYNIFLIKKTYLILLKLKKLWYAFCVAKILIIWPDQFLTSNINS